LRLGAARGRTARRRAGFTLVEVIVVLVILAILAAIAIPALTGYIDKAKWRSFESEVHTARTAFQTLIIEEISENGGSIVLYDHTNASTTDDNPNGHFSRVRDMTPPGETDPANKIYDFYTASTATLEEYKQLTGSTAKFRANALTDGNGAVLMVVLTYLDYYESLVALDTTWAYDFTAADPLGKFVAYQKTKASDVVYKQKYASFVPGFTCWKLAWKGGVVGAGNGAERVY
jgi:type IV pilus assembly protein PilA